MVWACPRSLATTRGTVIFPLPTEMFQFSRFPPHYCGLFCSRRGVAPFGDVGLTACSRLPRPFRSVATSFVGTQRQGIHRLRIMSSLTSHQRSGAGRSVETNHTARRRWRSSSPSSIMSVRQVCKVHRNPLDLGRSSGSQRPSPLNRAENITLVHCIAHKSGGICCP